MFDLRHASVNGLTLSLKGRDNRIYIIGTHYYDKLDYLITTRTSTVSVCLFSVRSYKQSSKGFK